MSKPDLYKWNARLARVRWGLSGKPHSSSSPQNLFQEISILNSSGRSSFLEQSWYVTQAGLLRLSVNRRCNGIEVQPVAELWNPSLNRFAFKATVFKSDSLKGFVGYGDADPSNVSPLVHGAEMRVAETRAVNRALRKAYGIGICSVEELGSLPNRAASRDQRSFLRKPAMAETAAVQKSGTVSVN